MAKQAGYVFFLLYILLATFTQVLCSDAKTMSVVIGGEDSETGEFVQIIDPPEYIDNSNLLTVEYTCTDVGVVAVELAVQRVPKSKMLIFRKKWKCDGQHVSRKKKIRLRLSDDLGFRPGYLNKEINFGADPTLRAFIVRKFNNDMLPTMQFRQSQVSVSYSVQLTLPYSRPKWRPYKRCVSWDVKLLQRIPLYNHQVCPFEEEIVELVDYPAVFNGLHYGIYRHMYPYVNPELETTRTRTIAKPAFTLSMWVYLIDYCPARSGDPNSACGMFLHSTWNNLYMTPLLLIDYLGYLRIEAIVGKRKKHFSHKVNWKLPQHQWLRITLSFSTTAFNIAVDHGKDFNETYKSDVDYGEYVLFDDTEGDHIVGGNDALIPSFVGYVGQATFYRRRVLRPDQIPFPSPYHAMFELGLSRREEKCRTFLSWLTSQVDYYTSRYRDRVHPDSCRHYFQELLTLKTDLQCPVRSSARPKKFRILNTFIRQSVRKGLRIGDMSLSGVAVDIHNNATALIEEDTGNVPEALPLLKQAACLGNYDAMYKLSVILNNGLMVKADEIQAQAYLMLGALEQHELSALALGCKHIHGIGGAPVDKEQAYFYYKYVAGKTKDHRETHKDTDVLTETVRLTDETAMQQQTDEDGDVFQWLKHQAMSGVASAQIQMGRALFWGSQGLKRNVHAAMKVFKAGADQGNADMMYDYGINIVNGRAPEKNKSKGIEYMKKAAKKNHPLAINGLGYVAFREGDYPEAVKYFNKAYKLGSADSAYYLGHMLLEGYHPDEKQDWDKAHQMFEFAARRGHYDAAILFAYIAMKGTSKKPRNVYLGTEWARFIAEKNPSVGIILRKGLHAYRHGDISMAFFYYLLAAETGTEVGNFNLAWLCDENKEGLVSQMEKECTWTHFNRSAQREYHLVDAYALIKMGDYHWYGCKGNRDIKKASEFYANAAIKGDPHALFNLGFMVEEGVDIPDSTWNILKVPRAARANNVTLLVNLYSRCKESRKTEAFIPCSLALYKVQLVDVWTRYHVWMKLSSFLGVTVVVTTTLMTLYNHFRVRQPTDELI